MAGPRLRFFLVGSWGRHSDIPLTSEVVLGDDEKTNVPILTANHAGVKWLRKVQIRTTRARSDRGRTPNTVRNPFLIHRHIATGANQMAEKKEKVACNWRVRHG